MSSTFKYQRFDLIRCKEIDGVRSGVEERVRVLDAEAAEREARTNGVERELRLEREWRTSLQEISICNTEKISQLHQEMDQLKRVSEVRTYLRCDLYCLLTIPRPNKSHRLTLSSPPACKFQGNVELRARATRRDVPTRSDLSI